MKFFDFGGANAKTLERPIERLLSALCGAPASVTVDSSKRALGHERIWDCGCRASSGSIDSDVTTWKPCTRHRRIVLAATRSESEQLEDAPFLDRRLHGPLGLLAFILSVAVIGKTALISNGLLKRAEEAEGAALVDPLTGLYNRRGWDRRIFEEGKRLNRDARLVVAVFIIDVDGLKATNDRLGHHAGDVVLRKVADVIHDVTRENDVSARLGGDEFGIMALYGRGSEAEAVRTRLERGFTAAGVSASIGLTLADSLDAVEEAMMRADVEMYNIKKTRSAHPMRR